MTNNYIFVHMLGQNHTYFEVHSGVDDKHVPTIQVGCLAHIMEHELMTTAVAKLPRIAVAVAVAVPLLWTKP